MSGADFDWNGDDAVVIREQPATAVFKNARGQIVVRQQGEVFEDDPYVVVDLGFVQRLVDAILAEAGINQSTPLRLPPPLPKDKTAAERQRRRRDKGPDSHASDRDGDRDELPLDTLP